MLAKNESGRWIEKVLEQMKIICDDIVVLDDCSTDETPDICKMYGADVFPSIQSYWSTDELKQRKFLWELATHVARFGDWILCLDADETFDNPKDVPIYVLQAEKYNCNGLSFKLFDMWNETHYRDDKFWCAHKGEWPFLVKYENKDYFWKQTPLHCGRFPMNAGCNIASCPVRIQHWGWSRPEDRQEKYERYMKADPEGKYGFPGQYKSIMDENPVLRRFI